MFLRAIHLSGFKTFARPTEVRVEAGLTAIVGPNGSGKTNLVDAVRWVLGETQARDLRGRRMEEVIYAGGERRPRAAAAEVTLVLDNSSRRLPVDYQEVAIRRRVDRSGESDYFLNGTRVRRRDILDLLAATGLLVDSYAIVAQPDIEAIVVASPPERRRLLEEAARVGGIRARRREAVQKLQDLAQNLLRLEDVRGEIEPRLEAVRVQRDAFHDADAARRRLELLKGSLVFEEWRAARDAHRRASSQAQGLERRLAEARSQAEAAEEEFRRFREEQQAAQDRRLQRQKVLGAHRLELSAATHERALAEERARGQASLAAAAEAEAADLASRLEAASALEAQLRAELEKAAAAQDAIPPAPPEPAGADPAAARDARRAAQVARRRASEAASEAAAARTRRQFLEETLRRQEAAIEEAEAALPAAEAAAESAGEARRLRAELEALESLGPADEGGRRLGDLIIAEPGWEAALSAALGPLLEAWIAGSEAEALAAADPSAPRRTLLYPTSAPAPVPGSLLEHVRVEPGAEAVAARLLGGIPAGPALRGGLYAEPGLVRAGSDPGVALAARRRALRDRLEGLEHSTSHEGSTQELARLRVAVADRDRLPESRRRLAAAAGAEAAAEARLPELEQAAAAAESVAAGLDADLESRGRRLAEHRVQVREGELERLRWADRKADLGRQLEVVARDRAGLEASRGLRMQRVQSATRQAEAVAGRLAGLRERVAAARQRLEQAEAEAPAAEAELHAGARRLLELEEARVDARLKVGTLQASLDLMSREAELALARMQEVRERLPQGVAPEEVPGGKAREREMRALERRLEEIGPTNPLAETECAELEQRYETLHTQLEDITAARADLERLADRLRQEEDTRYDAVFGAVASNFQEYFAELSAGGRATLRHVAGEEGPQSGVEILVQPPRKRLQNVTLLSSGERSLTALALVLAMEAVNPSPFVILDEVDAALDDANVGRFAGLIERLGRERQFLVITHNYLTMAHADALYGVHLDESGCSHLVSVRLEDVRKPSVRRVESA